MTEEIKDFKIKAAPSKRFFVEMLTRDIELADAILDLLDNSLDGAVRSNKGKTVDLKRPFEGYWAKITLDQGHFRIEDNCGGIPLDIAANYAFRFGRPDPDRDQDLQTVGVYGIGMKRALFKLGTDSRVSSNHREGSFGVHIDAPWIAGDVWELDLDRQAETPSQMGVIVEVKDLHDHIKYQFDKQKGNFQDALAKVVRDHYAYIIKMGFKVFINGELIEPAHYVTLVGDLEEGSIAPYVYQTSHDGVEVNLVMGMYERFPSDGDLEDMSEGRRSKHAAGWTIVCNDRVVLANDTTHVTGWGEAGVPAYHSQFVMLAGIVEFKSNSAKKLPVTTTKRGVDLNSPLYSEVKDVMRAALKHFTSFTNHWKGQSPERDSIQTKTEAVDVREAALKIPADQWKEVRVGLKGKRFVPQLPKPVNENSSVRISFTKPKVDLRLVQEQFFDPDESPKPGEVGEAAFDWALKKRRTKA